MYCRTDYSSFWLGQTYLELHSIIAQYTFEKWQTRRTRRWQFQQWIKVMAEIYYFSVNWLFFVLYASVSIYTVWDTLLLSYCTEPCHTIFNFGENCWQSNVFFSMSPSFFSLHFLTLPYPVIGSCTHTHTKFIHKSKQCSHSEAKTQSRHSVTVSGRHRAWRPLKQTAASRSTTPGVFFWTLFNSKQTKCTTSIRDLKLRIVCLTF